MPSVTITDPAANGDPFPATITGDYSLVGGKIPPAAAINVSITEEPNGPTVVVAAVLVPVPPGGPSGTWSAAKPPGLTPGKKYTITATLGGASDTKTGIQN
jgi:hypothetical protein